MISLLLIFLDNVGRVTHYAFRLALIVDLIRVGQEHSKGGLEFGRYC